MEKTIRELNGVMRIELEDVMPPKQQIMSSRSFGRAVFDIEGPSRVRFAVCEPRSREIEKSEILCRLNLRVYQN